jgi:hypothetical protein
MIQPDLTQRASGGERRLPGGLLCVATQRFGTQSEQFVRNLTIWKLRRRCSIFDTRSGVRNTVGLTTGVVVFAVLCATSGGMLSPLSGRWVRRSWRIAASFS